MNEVQTNRTLPNQKTDIKFSDNEIGTSLLIDTEISGARNVIKKEAIKVLKYKEHKYTHSACEYKNKSNTIIREEIWTISKFFENYLTNMPGEKLQGNAGSKHTGQSAHFPGSTNVQAPNIFHGK